jgi:sugar/nucleoside kinase (ribokinase family)
VTTGVIAGLCIVDLVHRVVSPPGPDEKVTALSRDLAAGGPATNAAVTFAALGGEAWLLTVVGSGGLAPVVRTDLARPRLTTVDLAATVPDVEVNVSSVVVVDATGDRSVVSLDAAPVDESVAVEAARTALADATAEVVLLDGHYPLVALEVAAWGRARRIPVVLDAGRWKPHFAELVPMVDEVVCSAAFSVPTGSGFGRIADWCHAAGAGVVAQTHGGAPIELSTRGGRAVIPVPAGPVTDTLGAGDVLHGAYAFHRAAGGDPKEALRRAAEVASFACGFAGPRTWLPSWANR